MPANEETCLWRGITNELEAQIKNGAFEGSGRFPSANEISKRFSVSNITSRRVLAELCKIGLVEKGRGKGCRLTKKLSNDEILVTGDYFGGIAEIHSNYILSEILKGVLDAASSHGLNVTQVEPSYITSLMKSPLRNPLTNVIIIQCELHNAKTMEFLSGPEANVAIVHGLEPNKKITSVMDDLAGAAFIAVRHLAEKGHRRIAMLLRDDAWHHPRFDGYRQAVKELGLDFCLSFVKTIGDGEDSCAARVDELLAASPRPTAIFAASDFLAMDAIRHIEKKGLRVPQDMAVAGVDNRPEGRIFTPPLTTVDLQWRRQGERAIELLWKRMTGSVEPVETIAQEPLLIERKSA